MKIAIAQINPTIGDLVGNAKLILLAAERAVSQGAQLLLTPELALCGYPPRDLLIEPSFITTLERQLTTLAQALPPQLAVLVGTVTRRPATLPALGKPLYNSVALLQAGQVQQTFHKRLLPTYDVFDEDRYFQAGSEANVLELTVEPGQPPLRLGITICEDLWNDELVWPERIYALDPVAEVARQGVDLILNLSASPYSVNKQQLREKLLSHAARRHGCPFIYVNQVGGNDDLIFDGRSVACDAQGDLLARAAAFQSDFLVLEWDATRHCLQPGPQTKSCIAPQPEEAAAEIWQALVLGVGDYTRKCHFRQAVIGLSGGIDSALVAAIAVAALGAENVLGVLMPSPYSSDHSIKDALDLAANLGIKTQTLPIAPLMQTYSQTLEPLFAGTQEGIAEENIQARIRGNLLMAIANKFGHLLISTGNKSELAVGYCTLYGDMSGGLAAIADVPKTKIYALCKWLNREKIMIPTNVITKAPSAELKPGQMDQDSLPPYEVLDDILYRLIDQHQAASEIMAAGHPQAIVQRVIQLVHRAEFKRRQAAPGLKITERAFGSGWRMPIAAELYALPK